MKVYELKKETGFKSTEAMFDREEQTEPQCPRVDNIIRQCESAMKSLQWVLKNMESEDAAAEVDSALWDIDLKADMNTIRENIIAIRSWGESWKDLAIRIMDDDPGLTLKYCVQGVDDALELKQQTTGSC